MRCIGRVYVSKREWPEQEAVYILMSEHRHRKSILGVVFKNSNFPGYCE